MRQFVLPVVLSLPLVGAVVGHSAAIAQDACQAPLPPPSREPNIFTPAQESDLGDALAERFEAYLTILEDEALTAPLRQIGNRLVARLPATGHRVRFSLVDIPEANAFVLPGGRIYVSRKLIGLTRSEDELAGVLGHELGHLVARQQSVAMTKQLKEILGVTSVGDRQDMLAKHDRLLDNAARRPNLFKTDAHDSADQLEADRLGQFIVAAAGYDAAAHATLFDRFAGTRGDTGGFFSRFFGTTSPDAKRLRELLKKTPPMPAGCGARVEPAPDRYRAWQLAVAKADTTMATEVLPGLSGRMQLGSFRDQARHVRFSPDGRLVLAQDDTGITVLNREPMSVRFRIQVSRAESAAFTPDSSSVVFHTPDLRVERWAVSTGAVAEVRDVHWPSPCLDSALAPDARALACVDLEGHLTILDVESGLQLAQRRNFYKASGFDLFMRLLSTLANTRLSGQLAVRFSPTGRYLAAGYAGYPDSGAYLYDLEKKAPINLREPARRLIGGTFAFVAADRLAGLNARDTNRSGIIQLPSLQVEEMPFPAAALEPTSDPRFVVVRPHGKFALGLYDLQAKTVITGLDTLAADVFDGHYATERGVSHLGVFAIAGAQLKTTAELPPTQLPAARTAAISPDFRWLALSARGRGALWDLSKGDRVAYFRDFDGSFVEPSGVLYADMPDAGGEQRAIARFDPSTRVMTNTGDLSAEYARQYGPWLLMRRHQINSLDSVAIEYQVRDVRKPSASWTRKFDRDGPDDYWFHPESDSLALIWAANSAGGRDRLRQDPALRKTVNMGDLAGDYVIELLDAGTGTLRARRVLETGKGSFQLFGVLTRGDRLIVSDSLNRVLVYSLAGSELKGYVFGSQPTISADGRRLAVSTGTGRISVFDLDTLQRLTELRFRHDVPFMALSGDGSRLLAVTADQAALTFTIGR